MRSELFRPEVAKHRQNKLHGDVLLLPKLSHSVLVGITLVWILLTLVFLLTSSYTRKETVVGWLEPPEGVIRVYSESPGIVQKILVTEGQKVVNGQPLFIIRDDLVFSNGERLDTELLKEYGDQRAFIKDQLERENTMFNTRQKDLKVRLSSAIEDLKLVEAQLNVVAERLSLMLTQIDRYQSLKKMGRVSSSEFDNISAQALTVKAEQQTLLRNQLSQKNTIEQLQTELKLLPDESQTIANQLKSRLSDISQQIFQVNAKSSRTIKAPRDGYVNNLQIQEGHHVSTGSKVPLLTLFPYEVNLTTNLLLPVRSIGFVEPGQKISIRYDAFPYQKFGVYGGKISHVSKTILLPEELMNSPLTVQEPVYRVTASLSQPDVFAYGKKFPLRPGMTLSADISLEERSLIQWLLEPIYSLKGRI